MTARPRLTPAMADTRRAVRVLLREVFPEAFEAMSTMPGCAGGTGYDVPADAPLVLVALSGGADSLALAAATAFEAARSGLRAGAIVVDHGLQEGSAEVAARAAEQARKLGLAPVEVARVDPSTSSGTRSNGPEANARAARYSAFETALGDTGADAILLAHTLDDQAETVLLGLTRGAGASSISGMEPVSGIYLRPFLSIRREQTVAACADQGLDPWNDPHNESTEFTRVRIRREVLPVLERELGPGIAEALARTADHLQADAEVLDAIADEVFSNTAVIAMPGMTSLVTSLEDMPRAIRVRVYQRAAITTGMGALTSAHLSAVDALLTNWHGQAAIDVPAGQVEREDEILRFISTRASA
jgi:tRNA(Ile)-lysidine synthase